ncbi:MAG: hypothetical protein M0017_01415, partial [Desulfobacteraceae bacterium]|nr:hypothetical protein [Desulfobacteraceae bacterium]
RDLSKAVDLQLLLTALAFKYILTGQVSHAHIPDDPTVESERRQIFFGRAISIPTFYVRRQTRNRFLADLLQGVGRVRVSRRYPGYYRVDAGEYCLALTRKLRRDGADLIEAMGLADTVHDLETRLREPERAVGSRLTRAILDETAKKSPLQLNGRRFNEAAERYYRKTLRRHHLEEALAIVAEDLEGLDRQEAYRQILQALLPGSASASSFLAAHRQALLTDGLDAGTLGRLIRLLLLAIHRESRRADGKIRLMA